MTWALHLREKMPSGKGEGSGHGGRPAEEGCGGLGWAVRDARWVAGGSSKKRLRRVLEPCVPVLAVAYMCQLVICVPTRFPLNHALRSGVLVILLQARFVGYSTRACHTPPLSPRSSSAPLKVPRRQPSDSPLAPPRGRSDVPSLVSPAPPEPLPLRQPPTRPPFPDIFYPLTITSP